GGRAAQFANLERDSRDSIQRRAVVLAAGPEAGGVAGALAPGGRRGSRISNETPYNVARWGWRRDRKPGVWLGPWPRAGGAVRESRTRPHTPSRGGVGGGTGSRGCGWGLGPGRAARFANLERDPIHRRAVGLAAGPEAGGVAGALAPGGRRGSRISNETPY